MPRCTGTQFSLGDIKYSKKILYNPRKILRTFFLSCRWSTYPVRKGIIGNPAVHTVVLRYVPEGVAAAMCSRRVYFHTFPCGKGGGGFFGCCVLGWWFLFGFWGEGFFGGGGGGGGGGGVCRVCLISLLR